MGAKLSFGQAALNDVFYDYKYRAKRKGIEFSLNKEDFKELTSKNCHYCGKEPSQSRTRPHPVYKDKSRFNGDYIYNGLDRKDVSVGYNLENVVPCCRDCNTIKHDVLTYDEMIVVMKTLLEYRKSKHG